MYCENFSYLYLFNFCRTYLPLRDRTPAHQQGCGSLQASQGCSILSSRSLLWRVEIKDSLPNSFVNYSSILEKFSSWNHNFHRLLPEELVGDLVTPLVDLREIDVIDKDCHVLP